MSEKRKLISGSSALRTNEIWSKTIGLDAHAGAGDEDAGVWARQTQDSEQTANLLLLAKMSNSGEVRGGCKRCGGQGHLTYQCRNPAAPPASIDRNLSTDSDSDSDSSSSSSNSGKFADLEKAMPHALGRTSSLDQKNRRKSDDLHKGSGRKHGRKHKRKKEKKEKKEKKKKEKKEKEKKEVM